MKELPSGWNLPPGCFEHHIEEAQGGDWCANCDIDLIKEAEADPADFDLCGTCKRKERDAHREDMADERRKYGDD